MSKNKKIQGFNFISVGGCSGIGMNLYAYICDDEWILVDMGLGFDNSFGREITIPSPEVLIKNKHKIKALFVTHSHEDHIGAIPYLWPMLNCPIYTRPFAAEMIRDKLYQFDLENEVPIIKVALKKEISLGIFKIEFISVAHSTPESSALAITTKYGTVLHSGDWKLDEEPVLGTTTDEETLKKYGDAGILALMCDSTNVFKEIGTSEFIVRKNLIDIVKENNKGRVVITCFASNLARLEACYYAAKESGRELVIAGRSLKKIEKIAKLAGYFSKIPQFLDAKKIKDLDPAKTLLVCTGSQGELNSALSKIANNSHKNVKLSAGDTVIFSSRVIPGNEKSVLEIQNALTKQNVKIIRDVDYTVHASGHPTRNELEHLYKLTSPKVLIPIHGEIIYLYKHAEIAEESGLKSLIPSDGDLIQIANIPNVADPKVIEKVHVGVLAVDGSKLIPISGNVYIEREKLSVAGVANICIKQSNQTIVMNTYGIFEASEKEEILNIERNIKTEIKLLLHGAVQKKNTNLSSTIEKIVKKIFLDFRGKTPVVFVHLY